MKIMQINRFISLQDIDQGNWWMSFLFALFHFSSPPILLFGSFFTLSRARSCRAAPSNLTMVEIIME